MARGVITATKAAKTGTVLAAETNGDATNGHTVPNSGKSLLLVRNSSVDTAYDVTIHIRATVEGKNVPEQITEVAFGNTVVFGPYPTNNYGTDLWIDVENAALKLRVIEP